VLPSIGKGIDEASLDMLTKDLRTIAVNALPANAFSVLAQETVMMRLGGAEGYLSACRESEGCIAELGKKAKVDYVARCNVNSMGGILMMDVELYNSNTGGIVGSFNSYEDNAKKTSDLIAIMRKNAPDMFKKIPGAVPSSIIGGISGLETAAGGELSVRRRYLVNVTSEPPGAALSFNGLPNSRCVKTPCRAELPEGEARILAVLDKHETADTTIAVAMNNQSVNIKLVSSFGILEILPAYKDNIGLEADWSLLINGKEYSDFENTFSPGNYEVRLWHECYEDVSFKVGIVKGKHEVFDMAQHIHLKNGGLELSAEKGWQPVSEPVFVNGKRAGETPFSGAIPICSKIEIGDGKDKVDAALKHNKVIRLRYNMDDYSNIETGLDEGEAFWKKKIWAIAANALGVGLVVLGYAQNIEYGILRNKYRDLPNSSKQGEFDKAWEKAESAKSLRNGLYVAGGVVFGAGVVLWFF
jgi:hypothetical protein